MVFLFVVGFTVFTQYFQVKLIDSFHYDTPKIGYYYSFIGICIIIIQGVIVRSLYGVMQEKEVVLMSLIIASIGFTLLSTAETTLWIYLFSIIVAMGQGIFSPFISGLISTEASKENQGETFGIQSAVQAGAQICGPLLGAQLVNININFSLWAGAILSFISAMVFYKKKWN
ncbi:MAG: MFS transporter [Saprospiraceae bacterium]|nr:MFS transporter [Saprospiraceae bacterium]